VYNKWWESSSEKRAKCLQQLIRRNKSGENQAPWAPPASASAALFCAESAGANGQLSKVIRGVVRTPVQCTAAAALRHWSAAATAAGSSRPLIAGRSAERERTASKSKSNAKRERKEQSSAGWRAELTPMQQQPAADSNALHRVKNTLAKIGERIRGDAEGEVPPRTARLQRAAPLVADPDAADADWAFARTALSDSEVRVRDGAASDETEEDPPRCAFKIWRSHKNVRLNFEVVN
jgi:hypothetical protein